MENERIRILLQRQKEQILAEVRTEIQKHELQAESDGRSIHELNGIIESQRKEIDHIIAGDEQLQARSITTSRTTIRKIGIFVKFISEVFMRWNFREED